MKYRSIDSFGCGGGDDAHVLSERERGGFLAVVSFQCCAFFRRCFVSAFMVCVPKGRRLCVVWHLLCAHIYIRVVTVRVCVCVMNGFMPWPRRLIRSARAICEANACSVRVGAAAT